MSSMCTFRAKIIGGRKETDVSMYLVNKENAGNELSDAVLDVLVDDLVDLLAELLGDLGLARLHQLVHHRENIVAALRTRIGRIQVVQRHVLDHLLLLVHLALGKRHVLVRLEVHLGRKGIRPADALKMERAIGYRGKKPNREADKVTSKSIQADTQTNKHTMHSTNKQTSNAP